MVGKELTRWWPVLEVGSHVRQLSLLPSYDLCDIVEHLVSWMKKSGLYPRLLGGKCQVPGMLHQIGMSCLPGDLNHTNMIWSQDSEPVRASLPTRRVFKEDSGTYVQSPSRILDTEAHTLALGNHVSGMLWCFPRPYTMHFSGPILISILGL